MLWTDLFYMIVITTFTGSVLTVAWLITSYLLDKTGYLNMSYRLGKSCCIVLDNSGNVLRDKND